MAWAEQLPDGTYRACWRDNTGRSRSTVFEKGTRNRFKRKEQALKAAIGQEAIARDNGPQNTGKGLTWAEWSERWFELRRVESLRNDRQRVRDYVMPHWGKARLKSITRHQVQAWVNQLEADNPELSPTTIVLIFRVFSRSMKDAVKAGHISTTPCTLIELPARAPGKERYLTKAEFWTMHAHMEQPWADAAVLLAYLGLRFSELAGLHWSRVDLERGIVTIVETWDQRAGVVKPYPKSKKPRQVPLPQEVVDVLLRHASEAKTCGQRHARGGTCSSDLVLRSPMKNLPLTDGTMQHVLNRVTEELGMAHVRNHDLRHSFASWLGQDGVPLSVIQQLLGHGQITTTQRYAHFGAEQYERVLAALR